MPSPSPPLAADRQFFAALTGQQPAELERLLTDNFVLVDVFRGGVVARADLIAAIASGVLRFDAVELIEANERHFGDTAVVVGRTAMRGSMAGNPWAARSRYTHVHVRRGDGWQLASAQGTPITDDDAPAAHG